MRTSFLTVMSVLALDTSAPAQNDSVLMTTRKWELTTRIDVSQPSEDNLRYEIPAIAGRLDLLSGPASDTEYREFVVETLTTDFLYWSRDQAGKDVTRLGESTTTRPRFEQFIQTLTWLQGRPIGRIRITSDPTSGTVEVDGVPKGLTETVIAASVGAHRVVVSPFGKKPCTRTVTVSAGASQNVHCG